MWQVDYNVKECEVIHFGRKSEYVLKFKRSKNVGIQMSLYINLKDKASHGETNGMLALIAKKT